MEGNQTTQSNTGAPQRPNPAPVRSTPNRPLGNRPQGNRPFGGTSGGPARRSFPPRRPGGPQVNRGPGTPPAPGTDVSDKAKQAESRNERRASKFDSRQRSEFDQKIISMRRVTRVVAGGRRFSFSVSLVAGDKKGRVGVGVGKAGDTALAIDKALRDAKKSMIKIPLTQNRSIPHEVGAKYSSAIVHITPAKGRGMVAGSAVRSVLELAGVTDVVAKLHSGSKNRLNQARGTVRALQLVKPKK